MPTAAKWKTLRNMKFVYRGEKKVKIEKDITRRAPETSKPPPPKPPITLSSDKPSGKGAEKGKGEAGGSSDSIGSEHKGKESKGKDDSEGKESKGGPRGGQHFQKWKKRIAMLHRVVILRRQREKRTGGQRIDERGIRIVSGRVQMTGGMSMEP